MQLLVVNHHHTHTLSTECTSLEAICKAPSVRNSHQNESQRSSRLTWSPHSNFKTVFTGSDDSKQETICFDSRLIFSLCTGSCVCVDALKVLLLSSFRVTIANLLAWNSTVWIWNIHSIPLSSPSTAPQITTISRPNDVFYKSIVGSFFRLSLVEY